MEARAISKRNWLKWCLIAAGWTLFGVFFASESIASRAYFGRPLNLGDAIVAWLICAYIWLAATPLVLYLAHRFPLERRVWVRNSLVHLGISCVLAILLLAIYVVICFVGRTDRKTTNYSSPAQSNYREFSC